MTLEDELEQANRNPEIPPDKMGELGVEVRKLLKLRMEIAEMENQLSGLKRDYNALAIDRVPNIMAELGIDEVRTEAGVKITVSREVQCKLIPEVKEQGLDWLEQNNYGAIVKREVSVAFGKDTESIVKQVVEAIRSVGVEPEVTKDVHPMTLKAWGKRQVEGGAPIPSEYFNVNVFSIVRVK